MEQQSKQISQQNEQIKNFKTMELSQAFGSSNDASQQNNFKEQAQSFYNIERFDTNYIADVAVYLK